MAPPQDRSCYVLELSVQPGGSRWAELHAYTDLAHIRACLDVFLENGQGTSAYHAISYGATLGIWVVQRGAVVAFVDLYPHIGVRLGDKPPATLDEEAKTRALVLERRKELYREDGEDEEMAGEDEWDDYDLTTFEEMELSIDWDAVTKGLPTLEKPLLAPSERTKIRYEGFKKRPMGTYFHDMDVKFGSYDYENGERLEPPFAIDLPDDEDDEDED